jgi:post-segregation antitoxin (ccd killing protein)
VPLGAFIDRDQHEQLAELARRQDCSMSRIVRRALAAELRLARVKDEAARLRPIPTGKES